MRGLMRFLMMFGPMIYRQYNKYMANKSRQQKQNDYVKEDQQMNEMDPRNQPKRPDVKDEDFV